MSETRGEFGEAGAEAPSVIPGADLAADDLSLKPLHLSSARIEPKTMTKRASLAVALPSGVGSGDFQSALLMEESLLK